MGGTTKAIKRYKRYKLLVECPFCESKFPVNKTPNQHKLDQLFLDQLFGEKKNDPWARIEALIYCSSN